VQDQLVGFRSLGHQIEHITAGSCHPRVDLDSFIAASSPKGGSAGTGERLDGDLLPAVAAAAVWRRP
jgi:hypothetical protein